jgi:ATP-dependent Clp protease protease subunit|tara:strand:+ start:125 stop:841 length:717 start_codon:yes stop_codon:yes gene_type:complete
MKYIIKKLASFAKEKKKTKKKIENPTEETQETQSPEETQEEKQSMDVKALLAGMAEEMESRTMLLQGNLDEEKAGELLSGFLALADLKPPKVNLEEGEMPYDPITLYISTYGGSADEMFGLFDMMSITKKKCVIETVGMGKVMSAGTLLLAAGTKGHRKIGKNCRVMLHQVSAGTFGPLFNMTTEIDAIQSLQESYINAMVSCTSFSKRKLKSLLNERVNVYLTAEEAVEYGIADIII